MKKIKNMKIKKLMYLSAFMFFWLLPAQTHRYIYELKYKSTILNSSLSKDLKIKLMSMRIEFGKVRKNLDEDLKEFVQTLTTDEMKQLAQKKDKTPEEDAQIETWNKQINED